ncbi:MAG: hypothetical protein AB8H47_21575 [Bacteroidia bacterium]
MDANEIEALAEAKSEDPYFALLHFLQAKQSSAEQDRFTASVYANNRRLFRQYLEGKTYISSVQKTMASHSAPKSVSQRPAMSFSILDFEPLCQGCLPDQGAFCMINPKHQIDFGLEDRLREQRAKYFGLGDKIKESITSAITTAATAIEATKIQDTRERDQALIDRFLAEPPRNKGRIKAMADLELTSYDPAAKSIEPDDELVTETFARLYVLQNRPEDAIRIYEQLSLRFPQKSAYFDARIEKIRTT